MNYKVVKDEKILKEFIEWLPELKENEKYYLCLFARNKYCKELTHIKSDKAQLKRFVSDKERMFQKIKQLEIEVGWYQQKHMVVPEEALALYITPNPRNMFKATVNLMVKLAESIRDQNVEMNSHQEALSEIQKSKSRTCWIDFDIDEKNDDCVPSASGYLVNMIKNEGIVNWDAVKVLRTRGGAHILVDPSKVEQKYKNTFYQGLSKFADQTGDNMIPVPGCTQGMFIPHFINL
jgi:hypothetical protein